MNLDGVPRITPEIETIYVGCAAAALPLQEVWRAAPATARFAARPRERETQLTQQVDYGAAGVTRSTLPSFV